MLPAYDWQRNMLEARAEVAVLLRAGNASIGRQLQRAMMFCNSFLGIIEQLSSERVTGLQSVGSIKRCRLSQVPDPSHQSAQTLVEVT